MSYYPTASQLHDDALLTGLMFVMGSIIGGITLHFLKPENDYPVPELSELPTTSNSSESIAIADINDTTIQEEIPVEIVLLQD